MEKIMNDVVRDISFGIGRRSKTRIDHELFDDPAWELSADARLERDGRASSLARSAAEIITSTFSPMKQDRVWVGVHFGSRGLGHKTATHFLKAAGGKDGMDVPPTVVAETSRSGRITLRG